MYREGNIIYFNPFFFKNGNPAKPKYFVVLKKYNTNVIVASLPTRKDSIPTKDEVERGCVELPNINLNCFVIPPNEIITECNKCFCFRTFIYGHQIDSYDLNELNEIYANRGTDFEIFGQMKADIFDNLRLCFRNSKSVKKKYVRIL